MTNASQIKAENPVAAKWLHSLSHQQIQALAHQHGVGGTLTRDIDVLRDVLIKLPSVQEVAVKMTNRAACSSLVEPR